MTRYNPTRGGRILSSLMDAAPYIIIGASIIVAIASIIALLGVDIYTGQISGEHLTQDKWFGLLVSLAGTGMILATVGLFMQGVKLKWDWPVLIVLGLIVVSLQLIDSFFDASSVDIRRFGGLVFAHEALGPAEARGHILFRFFVAGISLIGEPLATASVLFFSVMKKYLLEVLGESTIQKVDEARPAPRPTYGPYAPQNAKPSSQPVRPAVPATHHSVTAPFPRRSP